MKKKINFKLIIFVIAIIFMIILPNFSLAAETTNTVIIIKQAIAMWYYIIRTISIAIMLILLIFIGIKMAISTVASEKAAYKTMLVDWVAGMILVFGIHYIMLFILTLNETIVTTIKNSAEAIYEASPSEYGGTESKDKDNNDIETSVFDAVRTRAYDAKLINGTTGMIMYAYLVYYAYKFSFKYLKRYLTVAVLTLMAPVVAVSYAFNKVLSGKAKMFSKWLKEYFFNVFLQTIHALIYVVFVLLALRMSLNSISGMLLAFILLNYMSKADVIFRQIFGIGGSGSLVDDIANKDVGKELLKSARGLTTAYAGNKVLKAIAKKERKALFKPAKKAFGAAMAFRKNHLVKEKKLHLDDSGAETDFTEEDFQKFSTSKNKKLNKLLEIQRQKDAFLSGDKNELAKIRDEKQKLLESLGADDVLSDEIKELDEEIEALGLEDGQEKEDRTLAITSFLTDKEKDAFDAFSRTGLALQFSAKQRLSEMFDPDKYTEYDEEKGKYVGLKTKYKGRMVRDKNGVLRHQEARKRAPWQGWFSDEYQETDSIGMRMKENIKAQEILGMTDKDKELLEENINEMRNILVGAFNGIFSLPMIIENPVLGIGLMTSAIASKNSLLLAYNKKNQAKSMPVKLDGSTYAERIQSMNEALEEYSATGKLSVQTLQTMRKTITQEIKTAKDAYIVNDINKKHKKLVKSILKGTITVGGGIAGVNLTRSIKSTTPDNSTTVRTGGAGYAEREYAIDQYDEQDKINRKAENIIMDRTLNNMFGDMLETNKNKKQEELNSLSQDDTLRKAAVAAGLAVMIGDTLVPLTNEPITEETIFGVMNDKKDDTSSSEETKSGESEESGVSSAKELIDEANKKITDKLIKDTITQLSKDGNNGSSITEFTTKVANNQNMIVDQIESIVMPKAETSSEIKQEIRKNIATKVTKIKAEMVLAETTTEAFKEVASADGVESAEDISIENVQSSVEEKMKAWSDVNVDPTSDVVTSQSNSAIENLGKQRSELTEKPPKMETKLEALGGKSVQELIVQSVQSRHQALTNLNSKGASKASEETTSEMKKVLLNKQQSETQQLLADVLTESDENKIEELLNSVSDEDAALATIAVEIKRNNQVASKNGIKRKQSKYIDSHENSNNSNDVIKDLQERKGSGSKNKTNQGLEGPLTNLNQLLAKMNT